MTIDFHQNGTALEIIPEGRIDTVTAPELDSFIQQHLPGVTELTLNFKGVAYVSSAGLRAILAAQKAMNRQGSMRVTNVCENVMEVFDITGFVDILTIE